MTFTLPQTPQVQATSQLEELGEALLDFNNTSSLANWLQRINNHA